MSRPVIPPIGPPPARAAAAPLPAFRPGGHFTVGAEEELMLLAHTGDLREGPAADVVAAVGAAVGHRCTVTAEIFACQLELATAVAGDAETVVDALARARAALRRLGQPALAAGLHPTAALGDFTTTPSPRYDPIAEDFAGFFRTPTAAFQVHVGMPDEVTAMAAYRHLRHHLPVLRALGASSPFWHGRDSGLACARGAILRSYPRTGVPPVLRTWEDYERRTIEVLESTGVPDHTHLWWDLRPRPDLGTLEVRVMDAHWSLDRVAGLVALVQGLAVAAAVDGPPAVDLPDAALDEDDFHAVRRGLDARLLDPEGRRRPARQLVRDLVRRARRGQRVLGPGRGAALSALLPPLLTEDECLRQRIVARRDGLCGLVADLAARTGSELPAMAVVGASEAGSPAAGRAF